MGPALATDVALSVRRRSRLELAPPRIEQQRGLAGLHEDAPVF
jgi:hypothetical protein